MVLDHETGMLDWAEGVGVAGIATDGDVCHLWRIWFLVVSQSVSSVAIVRGFRDTAASSDGTGLDKQLDFV